MTLPELPHPGMPSRRRPNAIGLAAMLACAGALTACGGSSSSVGNSGPLAEQPDAAAAARWLAPQSAHQLHYHAEETR